MNVQILGVVPADFVARRDGSAFFFINPLPLFNLDAGLFFPGADAGARELLQRSGRPCLDFTERIYRAEILYTEYLPHLREQARTNYQPINCNFYDNFEAAIVTRRAVDLVYLDPFGEEVTVTTQLRDLKTHRTEEFVQLASEEWLRLDRIVRVDGTAAGASCTF
ncbi:MAG: hypothetical protein AAFZ52_18130 [Bacteroidota bacterium]